MKQLTQRLKELRNIINVFIGFLANEIKSRPRTFKIVVQTIFLVVTFLVVLQTLLQLTPTLFISLVEEQSGQVDLTFSPESAQNYARVGEFSLTLGTINFTDLEQKLFKLPDTKAMAPRWTFPLRVSNPTSPNQDYKAIGLMLDSEREKKQGMGNHLDVKNMKSGECWITQSLASLLQLQGQEIELKIDILGILNQEETNSSGLGSLENFFARSIAERIIKTFFENENDIRKNFNSSTNDTIKELDEIRKSLNSSKNDTIKELHDNILKASLKANLPIGLNLTEEIARQASITEEITNNLATIDLNDTIYDLDKNIDSMDKKFLTSELENFLAPIISRVLSTTKSFKIIETIESPHGKWPVSLGNVVVIDSNHLIQLFMDEFLQALRQTLTKIDDSELNDRIDNLLNRTRAFDLFQEYFPYFNIDAYAFTVNMLLQNREAIYTSEASTRQNLIRATDIIRNQLGLYYPVTVSSPLGDALKNFFLFQNFLDNTFLAIVFILAILAIFLIYSLMNSNVNERKYEFGILRVLGIKREILTFLILFQSLFFAVPGLVGGFLLAFVFILLLSYMIFDYTLLKTSYTIPASAIELGLGIGILVPFLSNLIPTMKVFSKTLLDSLNFSSRTVNDIKVQIAKLSGLGISLSKTISGLTLIFMGFLTFYVVPYGFVFADFALFLLIVNIVLLLMIVGLTLTSNMLQKPVEKLILRILLLIFWKDRPLESVVQKNLVSHKKGNKQTSLIFTLTISFLIFAGVAFRVNSNLITQQLQYSLGSDIVVKALPDETKFLKESELRAVLQRFEQKYPDSVRSYAFVSQPFSQQAQIDELDIMSLAQTPRVHVEMVSVDESYLRSIYEELYVPNDFDSSVVVPYVPNTEYPDTIKSLYTREDLQPIYHFDEKHIISDQNLNALGLDAFVGTKGARVILPKSLATKLVSHAGDINLLATSNIKFPIQVRGIVTKLPGFTFTGHQDSNGMTIITSHEDFRYIRDTIWKRKSNVTNMSEARKYNLSIPANSSYGVPKLGLLIRLNQNVEESVRVELFNNIQTLIDGKFTLAMDIVGLVRKFEDALFFMDIFFIVVATIATVLTFFYTSVTFTGNVHENLWELGVLRATGLNKRQIMKTYVLEALSLIISSIILGTSVGIILAVIVTVQFNLFTELPFKLMFPVPVFLFTIAASLFVAVFGPRGAVNQVKDKQISTIIKSLE